MTESNKGDSKLATQEPLNSLQEWIKTNNDPLVLQMDQSLNLEGNQLSDLFTNLFRAGVRRVPFIGTRENGVTKTYMLFDKHDPQHIFLWKLIGNPKNVVFTGSIENIPSKVAVAGPHIIINGEKHIPMGQGSDYGAIAAFTGDGNHPLTKGMTQEGYSEIERIFSAEGIKFSWNPDR